MKEIKINDETSIEVAFFLEKFGKKKVLNLKAFGDYGIGSNGNINGCYISSCLAAACFRWSFNSITFDFSELEYEMSNSLSSIFSTLQRLRSSNFEKTIVVSETNEHAIYSLLDSISLSDQIQIVKA